MPFLDRPRVQQLPDGRWTLLTDLVYRGRRDTWTVPAGFASDFASVPTAARWLIPADGPWTAAAIVHDWFCDVGIATGQITSRDADGVFRRLARELGTPLLRQWLLWAGVRWGALANPRRRAGVTRDLPATLAISLAAAPLVLPVSVAVAVGLLLEQLVELAVAAAAAAGGRR